MTKMLARLLALASLALMLLSNTMQATPTAYTWAQSYGVGSYDTAGQPSDDPFYGSGSDFPTSIAQMPDGGVVVVGQLDLPKRYANVYSSHTSANADPTLVRYAPDGTITWQRTLHQTDDSNDSFGYYQPGLTRIYQMQTDAQGNIFVGGVKSHSTGGVPHQFVAKFSADGSLVWQNGIEKAVATFGDPPQSYECGQGALYNMSLTNDGGVVVSTSQARPNVGYSIPTLAKFDASGALAFYAAYEEPQQYMGSMPVCQSHDGTKFVMLAQYPSNQGYNFSVTAVVTDATGNIVAERSIPTDNTRSETPRAIIATADGGFATLCQVARYVQGDGGVVVRKFNADLSAVTFEKWISRAASFTGSSLAETADGGLLIGGHTSAPGGTAGGGFEEAALVKLKADGTLDFASLLGGSNNEMYDDGFAIGANAIQTTDGGYAFAVATRSYASDSPAARKTDWWIVKTDANRKVKNFADLMIDQPLDAYTVTDTTRTPENITAFSRVTYSLSVVTTPSPTFNIEDTGANTGINKPTIAFQAAAQAITPPAPAITFSTNAPANAGDSMHFAATAPAGWNVRVQATSTPDEEASWTDLNDGNGGAMSETSSGQYALDSAAYPSGLAVYFRAIAALSGETDLVSDPAGPFSLDHAALRIAAVATSTSDPTNGRFAHTGDDIVYTLTFTNTSGVTASNLHVATTVPTYIETQTNLTKQFVASDVLISPGGVFVPETSAGANDAQIIWNVGDLAGHLQNFVRFTLHAIAAKVRTEQALQLPNDYAVYSSSNQPAGRVTGYDSGAERVETHLEGPIKLTVSALSGTVAPGQQFTYHLSLTNLGATTAAHAVAVFSQPEFSRYLAAAFSNTPPPTKKKPKKGTPPPFIPTAKLVYISGQSDPEVVMDIGPLTANQTVTIDLTFQAQWADPAGVPKLHTTDYAAAFLTDSAYATFTTNYTNAVTLPDNGGSSDFAAFFLSPTNIIASSNQDSGEVAVSLQGSLQDEPKLALSKQISNRSSGTGSTDGKTITNSVRPGGQVSFILVAGNTGNSEAADVYLQDRLPDHTTFVSASVVTAVDLRAIAPVKKKKKTPPPAVVDVGTLRVVPDSDGQHIRFRGLKLPPHVLMALQYTVQVGSGFSAPPNGSFINADCVQSDCFVPGTATLMSVSSIGSASTPHTPAGEYGGGAIQVTGEIVLPEPRVHALVASPGVSDDVNTTANGLNTLYAVNWSAQPLVNPANPNVYIPGVQRYYIHYENSGTATATGVHLDVPLPANTVFYRAAFVSLPPNSANAQDGYLPGTVLTSAAVPAGFGVTAPAFLTNGPVSFTFSQLPAQFSGDVMIEVIIKNSAIASSGSLVNSPSGSDIVFADNTSSAAPEGALASAVVNGFGSGHRSTAKLTTTPIADATRVPQIGIEKIVQKPIIANQDFTVTFVFFNYGDTEARHADVSFPLPENTRYVAESHTVFSGAEFIIDNGSGVPVPGDALDLFVDAMPPHTASAITFTLHATGPVGSTVDDKRTYLACEFTGLLHAPPTHTPIEALPLIPKASSVEVAIIGRPLHQFLFNGGDVLVVDLGGGRIVAQGGGNIVAQGGGNIVAQGGGNIVAQGGGNVIPIGVTDGATLLANTASIVAQGGGNIFVPQGNSIVAQGGGNIVAAGAGNIVAQGGGNIVAQGGGNIVAQGGGNIVAQGGGNIFGGAAGQIVAQGGGNIVAQGGGNIVAQGGGNIVAQGGGNIVAQGGGNILASTPSSSSLISTPRTNIVAQGGGNIVAQGGGN